MNDQAEKLRNIVKNLKENNNSEVNAESKKAARVIAVTSGKGGVGKTNITVNLGIALSKRGLRVVILDVDLGLANIDILLGKSTRYTLVELIRGERNIFEVLADGPDNVKFISGGSGVDELAQLDKSQIDNLVSNIALLDKLCDVILIDTGAGISNSVISFLMAADEVLLVTTPEPTAITDGYAMIKTIVRKDRHKIVKVIVNKADSIREVEDVLDKLFMVSERFLSFELEKMGYILNDECVSKAVKQQKPFSLVYPKSHATYQITQMAETLLHDDSNSDEDNTNVHGKGIRGFFSRLLGSYGI